MYRRNRMLSVLSIILAFSILFMSIAAYAELAVQIMRQPNVEKILLEKGPKKIVLTARSNQQNVTFAWDYDGPGKLQGDLTGPGIFYLLPPDINQRSVQVVITVVVSDTEGYQASDSSIFTLVSEQAPTPTQAPTTVTPTQIPTATPSQIAQFLKQGDACFERKWFTTPEEENAFNYYKAALVVEPTNRHARERMYEILKFYKYWGDSAYDQKNCEKIQGYYERYEYVATYLMKIFGEQSLQQELQLFRQRSEDCTTIPPPRCASESKTPEEIQQTLPVNLKMYEKLKNEEKQGIKRNTEMITVINNIICDFLAVEAILQANYDQTNDKSVLPRIQNTQLLRERYEKELLDRIGGSVP